MKNKFKQPVVIYLYGMPGSGKTFVASHLSKDMGMAHVSSERIRHELFEEPRHDKTEIRIINEIMMYMTEEFLNAGVSVIYDTSVSRHADRKALRELCRKNKAKSLMIWLQIDNATAWARSQNRDMRKSENKYFSKITQPQFDQYVKIMQSPTNEDYVVLSGKHVFASQKKAVLRRLNDMNVLNPETSGYVPPKPELVNLVSRAQNKVNSTDYTRRNISIQ